MGSFGINMMHTPVDNSCPKEIMTDARYWNNIHRIYVCWGRAGERTKLFDDCLKRNGQTLNSVTDKISPNRNRF